MKNSNIKQIAFTAVMGLFLSACGGGSGGSNNPPIDEIKIPSCGTDIDDKGKVVAKDVTGKTIKKVGDGAEVRIWHFPDAMKRACMISGEAIIVDN